MYTHHPIGAVEVDSLNLVEPGVGPVELLCLVVDGETVGSADLCRDHRLHVPAAHVRTLDLRRLVVPVRPKHAAEISKMDYISQREVMSESCRYGLDSPSNAEATFIQSTKTQRFLKTI